MNISFVTGLPTDNAVHHFRVKIPLDELVRIGYDVKQVEVIDSDALAGNDVNVFVRTGQREYLDLRRALESGEQKACASVVDYDDCYHLVPLSNPHAATCREDIPVVEAMLSESDAFTTTTERLRRRYRRFTYRSYVCPNCFDFERAPMVEPVRRSASEPFRIVFAGGNSHGRDIGVCLAGLKTILEQHDNVEIVNFGCTDPLAFGDLPVTHVPPVQSFSDYVKTLAEIRPHVGVAPLTSNAFNEYKSPIKALEYAAFGGAAPVCSAMPPFTDALGSADVAYAAMPHQWVAELRRLICNEDARLASVRSVQSIMRRTYDIRDRIGCWLGAYRAAIDHRKAVAHA